jgi:hypothetical protein
MGLVFDDALAGQQLFAGWMEEHGNADPLEELRIAIIEGDIEGLRPGYTVHLSGDVEGILARATAEGMVAPDPLPWMSRVNRMYPQPGSPPLLAPRAVQGRGSSAKRVGNFGPFFRFLATCT